MSEDAVPGSARSRSERFRRVMELFEAVVGLPVEQRTARLVELSRGEDGVRAEVEAMLAADARTSTPMTVGGGLGALARIGAEGAVEVQVAGDGEGALPVLSGQYRILRRIGEGGMGVVYEAEQSLPRRRVALKAIRPGFSSRQMLRRFEQEAHILGRLHHPGIAQVYEAGVSGREHGEQAFIAMELVDGAPLSDWARGRSPREKVELVARVCDAVQHAHQRRVIHRDLKPGNVLVDKSGAPRILDFGVARLADDDTDGALPTREGQLLGTLPYMSPEQLSGDGREVDARADVYALGVILYELLSGRLPHPPEGRALAEMALAIRDEDPPLLGKLDRSLRGDLESIVAKALAKERERRYQSAFELREDLARHLAGEAVRARGESGFYVLRRQVRRHRWVALASAIALLSLIAFAVFAEQSARRAQRDARRLATALRANRIELGRNLASAGNLAAAERLIWDAHFEREDETSRWALWDLYRHVPCVRTFAGEGDSVLALAVSPRGDLLAAGSHDGTVRVWDWESGECFAAHPFTRFNAGVAFTPDGEGLCAVDLDGAFACWDARTGNERWRASEPVLPHALVLAAAAERPVVACVGEREQCALIDLDAKDVVRRITLEGERLCGVAFDRAGRRLAIGCDDGSVRLYDVDTGAALARLDGHGSPVLALAFGPLETLASGDSEGTVLLRSLESGEVTGRFASTSGGVRRISLAKDGERLLLCGSDGVEAWDLAGGAPSGAAPRWRQTASAACFAPGDARIASDSLGGAIRVWDIEPPESVRALPLRLERDAVMALTLDASAIVRNAGDGRLELVDLEGQVIGAFQVDGGPVDRVALDPTRKLLAVLIGTRRIVVGELLGGRRCCELDFASNVESLRFSHDGRTLAISLANGELRLFDPGDGAERHALVAPSGSAQRIAFSADGERLATSHTENRIELRRARDLRLERTLVGPRAVYSLTFDPGGELLYAGTWDGRVELWDTARGRLVRTHEAHQKLVQGIVTRRDGRVAVTTGGDGLLRLWSTQAESCLLTLDAKAGAILTFGFSADGALLRAVHADGRLREWDLGCFERYVAGNEGYQRALRGLPPRS